MSHARIGSVTTIPARHNLSAAPPGTNPTTAANNPIRPLVLNSAGSGTNSAASTTRGGGGGETDRAFQAFLQANMSPKTTQHQSQQLQQQQLSELNLDSTTSQPQQSFSSPSHRAHHSTQSSQSSQAPALVLPSPPSSQPPISSVTRKTSHNEKLTAASPSPILSPTLAQSPSTSSLQSPLSSRKLGREKTSHTEAKEQQVPGGAGGGSHHSHGHHPRDRDAVARSIHKRLELEEELIEQKAVMQRKDEYISGLQRNCETLSALCAKHMQQVTLLKTDFDRVSSEKHALESEAAKTISNEALAIKLLKENEDLTQNKKQLSARLETLQQKLYTFQHQISELTDQKEDLVTDLNKEKIAATSLRGELEEMKNILNNEAASSNKSTDGKAHEFETKLLVLKKEHEMNKSSLENLTVTYKALQSSYQKVNNILTQVNQEKAVLEQDVTRWKSQALQNRRELKEANETMAILKEQFTTISQEHTELQQSHAGLIKKLPELESALKTSEKQRSTLKKEYETCWSTKEDLLLQVKELESETSLLKKQLDILSAGAGQKRREAAATELTEMERVQNQLAELQERYTALEELLQTNEASMTKWKGKYETSQTERKALQEELEESQAEAMRLMKELKVSQAQQQTAAPASEGLQQSLANATTALAALQTKFNTQQTELDALKSDATKTAKELTHLRDQLTAQTKSHDQELADLRSKSESYVSTRLDELEKQLSQLQKRLMESQHANAELNALLDTQPRVSAAEVARLAKREKELQSTIAKLLVNEEASEASFTCFSCVKTFTKPVTCIPCGHSYCLACIEKTHTCSQCRPPVKVTYYSNELLEELASRFIFRKQALMSLKEMTSAQQAATTTQP